MATMLLLLAAIQTFAVAMASNTLDVDTSIRRIRIGPNAYCDSSDDSQPQICLSPDVPVTMCSFQLTRQRYGTIVAQSRFTGETVWAVSPTCAVSVGPDIVFGGPGSVTITPQRMDAVTDNVWTVLSEISLASGYIQRVQLAGTTYAGTRYKQAGTGSPVSYVMLDNGVLVFDTGITRNVVLGGLATGARVISMYTIFAPEPYNAPVISVVDVPVDGSSQLLLREYASPSVCGSTLARQETRTQIALGECLALTDSFRAFLNITDEGLYESALFPACPATGNQTLVVQLFAADCTGSPDATAAVPLGRCITSSTQMLECQVAM